LTKVILPDDDKLTIEHGDTFNTIKSATIDFEELKRLAKQSALKKQDES